MKKLIHSRYGWIHTVDKPPVKKVNSIFPSIHDQNDLSASGPEFGVVNFCKIVEYQDKGDQR